MEISRNEFEIISGTVAKWEKEGKLTQTQATELMGSLQVKNTERQQIAQYFFIVAISCAILAFGAIFLDEKILEKLKNYYALSNLFISGVSLALTALWFFYTARITDRISNAAREVYMVLGGLILLIALVYLFKDLGSGHYYSRFLLTATIALFSLSLFTKSRVLWLAGILSLAAWFCAFSTLLNKDYLFLGMNYPMRITVLGAIIISFSFVQSRIKVLRFTTRLTYLSGLLMFLAGLWAVSVFGNYGHIDAWTKVRQTQVIGYAIIFALFSIGAFFRGVKQRDDVTRDVGVLFLLLNLYTRYFEYFWDNTNKGLFFLVLAVSFYIVGRWLDKRRQTSIAGH